MINIDEHITNKKLLTSEQIIAHMEHKGILFDIISKNEAKIFLEQHSYYFKLAAYRKNYDKSLVGKNIGKYINLDFAYLKDLYTIDVQLRSIILQMCLDIEHFLKTMLLKDIENNELEDGYNIVNKWDEQNFCRDKIKKYLKTSYCRELIIKYEPNYPIWVLVELISFGDLCKLIEFYNKIYPKRLPFNVKLLFPIRDLRNACAHSNCLIHDVRADYGSKPNAIVLKAIQSMKDIGKRIRNTKLRNKPIHDFICLLYVYPLIVESNNLLRLRKNALHQLIKKRMLKHVNYYEKNLTLQTTYQFIRKVWYHFQGKY